jgi:DNA-binding CsgD family transcriptional regulator
VVGAVEEQAKTGRGFRHLSLTLGLVGIGALVSTLASAPSHGWWTAYTISAIVASVAFLTPNLYFFFVAAPKPWMPVVQALEISAIGLVAALVSDPESYDGLILVALSVVLFAKHRVLKSRTAMLGVLAVVVALDTVGSYVIHSAPLRLVVAMGAIAVGVFAIVYFAFYDEIQSLVKDVGDLRHSAEVSEHNHLEFRRDLARAHIAHDSARTEVLEAERRVQSLERQVADFEAVATPVDVDQFGLSEREIDVLRTLVEIRGRNRDIGNTLGITERTVKSHIYKICNKVGIDTRLELVELFRWNWPQGEPVEDPE